MRVIQTKNDTIRLIFDPKADGLRLSDFLIVRDGEDNFLGQIVEIYDDKFNAEENVASVKLVYRILPDQQVVPYDNFTPSRECEIAKIKLEEIEKCLNTDKITVPFGISTKNNQIVNINLDFFNNNPVVFADKLDEVNCAFENIAQKLKAFKKVVVIDYTGNLEIKNAKRIKALVDFKLPLDYYSLDYIWQKALEYASIEAQTELDDMFEELKKFVNSTEDKYIPFPRFIKVIEQQYKVTPALELKIFLNKLKRYWNEDLFSRSKKEFQGVSKAVAKDDVVIIDFSKLKLEWHKEFLEFVIRQISDTDTYLLLRLNENNSNPEIINNLYINNPKLTVIPSISYGYAKMPQIMEFANNYILYKTLNPRRDFGFANAQVGALNSSSFMIFGKDTMDFMFTLKNYIYNEEDLEKQEDKKIYIDLNLELEEMTSAELAGDFELKNIHIQNTQPPKARLQDEVTIQDVVPEVETLVQETPEEEIFEDEQSDDAGEYEYSEIETEAEESSEMEELIEASLKNDEEYLKNNVEVEDIQEETLNGENEIPLAEEELDYFVNPEDAKEDALPEITEEIAQEAPVKEIFETETVEEVQETVEPEPEVLQETETAAEPLQAASVAEIKETDETKESIIIVKEKPILKIDDFSEEEPENVQSAQPENTDKEEDNSLKELAQKSIEARFDEVIEETALSTKSVVLANAKNTLKINDSVSIDLDKIKNNTGSETILPIFKNEETETEEDAYEYQFEEGMRVAHEKYGAGSVLKVVKYSNRCLLQIEFDNTGKRLLDPKIARIKPA